MLARRPRSRIQNLTGPNLNACPEEIFEKHMHNWEKLKRARAREKVREREREMLYCFFFFNTVSSIKLPHPFRRMPEDIDMWGRNLKNLS